VLPCSARPRLPQERASPSGIRAPPKEAMEISALVNSRRPTRQALHDLRVGWRSPQLVVRRRVAVYLFGAIVLDVLLVRARVCGSDLRQTVFHQRLFVGFGIRGLALTGAWCLRLRLRGRLLLRQGYRCGSKRGQCEYCGQSFHGDISCAGLRRRQLR
jgi:hypothetical protein